MAKMKGLGAGLKRRCRGWCRRSAAREFLPLDPGLTPWANCSSAAARLLATRFARSVPPRNFIPGCDTVSESQIYPGRGLLVDAGQIHRQHSPEEFGAHLHGQVARIIAVPNPDAAMVLEDAGITLRPNPYGVEGAGGGLDLFF